VRCNLRTVCFLSLKALLPLAAGDLQCTSCRTNRTIDITNCTVFALSTLIGIVLHSLLQSCMLFYLFGLSSYILLQYSHFHIFQYNSSVPYLLFPLTLQTFSLQLSFSAHFNPLAPNDIYIYTHTSYRKLTSRRCILNVYSTNILTEYFKHAAHSPFFPLQDAVYFIMLSLFVPVIVTF
jgi:hypothetical protein